MNSYVPLAWIAGSALFLVLSIWIAVRLIRWAKRGSKGASLLGWGMTLSATAVSPQPPPQEMIEALTRDVQGRKNSDSSAPDHKKSRTMNGVPSQLPIGE
jgi:hypothetical protein